MVQDVPYLFTAVWHLPRSLKGRTDPARFIGEWLDCIPNRWATRPTLRLLVTSRVRSYFHGSVDNRQASVVLARRKGRPRPRPGPEILVRTKLV